MQLRNGWVCVLGVGLAAVVAACGGGQGSSSSPAEPASAAPAGSGQKVDASTAGSVKGTVALDGKAPMNDAIKMNADPVCLKQNTTPQFQETFTVGADGTSVANVFVYVKNGLGNYIYDAPSPMVQIDQKNCRYHPHVFGIRVGQTLEILNSDPTLHNIHALPKDNSEFNTGQPIQGMKTTHKFTKKEVMVPFRCDVHGWMNAFIGVLDHPYFTVTKEDGKFELSTLPPGTYTVEAWHEKLGATTQSVTIGPNETKEITFTFKAPAATPTD